MANLQKTFDGEYHYPSGDGEIRCCRLRIYEDLASPEYRNQGETFVIFIATMLWQHTDRSSSLTNEAERIAAEGLAMQRNRQTRRGQRQTASDDWEWYEHYPTPPDTRCPEAVSRVRFETQADGSLARPQWTPVDKHKVERRIGQPL